MAPSEKIDQSATGLSFIDILFALVVSSVFTPLLEPGYKLVVGIEEGGISWASFTHTLLALALTLTSWIGYRGSANSPRFTIRFFNIPFLKFLLDMLMVVTYWLTVVSAEPLNRSLSTKQDALPEAAFVFFSFLLYLCWDGLNWLMKQDHHREPYDEAIRIANESPLKHIKGRSRPTWAVGAFSSIVLITTLINRNQTESWVILTDVGLIIALVAFRDLKEESPPNRPKVKSEIENYKNQKLRYETRAAYYLLLAIFWILLLVALGL